MDFAVIFWIAVAVLIVVLRITGLSAVRWVPEITLFFLTILLGFAGASFLGSWLNWPDAGAVVAIAFVGACLMWRQRHGTGAEKKDEEHSA